MKSIFLFCKRERSRLGVGGDPHGGKRKTKRQTQREWRGEKAGQTPAAEAPADAERSRRGGGAGGGAWEDCRGVSSPGTSDTAAKKKGWGLKSKCPGSRTKGGHGKGRREGPGIN